MHFISVFYLVSVLFVAACEDVKAVLPDNGELLIQINGLPNDAKAGILVNGPDDYERKLMSKQR